LNSSWLIVAESPSAPSPAFFLEAHEVAKTNRLDSAIILSWRSILPPLICVVIDPRILKDHVRMSNYLSDEGRRTASIPTKKSSPLLGTKIEFHSAKLFKGVNMRGFNRAFIMGHLGIRPEMKRTSEGKPYTQ